MLQGRRSACWWEVVNGTATTALVLGKKCGKPWEKTTAFWFLSIEAWRWHLFNGPEKTYGYWYFPFYWNPVKTLSHITNVKYLDCNARSSIENPCIPMPGMVQISWSRRRHGYAWKMESSDASRQLSESACTVETTSTQALQTKSKSRIYAFYKLEMAMKLWTLDPNLNLAELHGGRRRQ